MSCGARAFKPCSKRAVFLNVRNKQTHCQESPDASRSCGQYSVATLLIATATATATATAIPASRPQQRRRQPGTFSDHRRAINHGQGQAHEAASFQSFRHSRKPARLTQPAVFAPRATQKSGHQFCQISVNSRVRSKRDQQVFRRAIGIRAEWA